MATQTFDEIANMVTLHCPQAGIPLARTWTDAALLELMEERDWSWRLKRGEFVFPAAYTTGTATATQYSDTVTIAGGGVVTIDWVGRQFHWQRHTLVSTHPWPALSEATDRTSSDVERSRHAHST